MSKAVKMRLARVHQLLGVCRVMLIACRVVKEGGNVEVTMHLSMSIAIVKVCANAMRQMVARTNAVVEVNRVLWSLTPRSKYCVHLCSSPRGSLDTVGSWSDLVGCFFLVLDF